MPLFFKKNRFKIVFHNFFGKFAKIVDSGGTFLKIVVPAPITELLHILTFGITETFDPTKTEFSNST